MHSLDFQTASITHCQCILSWQSLVYLVAFLHLVHLSPILSSNVISWYLNKLLRQPSN